MTQESAAKHNRSAVFLTWIAGLFGCLGLTCVGTAMLHGDGWVSGRGVEDYNRLIAVLFVVLPLAISGICAAVALCLFKRGRLALLVALVAGLPVGAALVWGACRALGV